MIALTTYLTQYKVGDIVDIVYVLLAVIRIK